MGILVGGRLRCLGSAQRLKSRFGMGYQLEVSLALPDKAQTEAACLRLGCVTSDPVLYTSPLGRKLSKRSVHQYDGSQPPWLRTYDRNHLISQPRRPCRSPPRPSSTKLRHSIASALDPHIGPSRLLTHSLLYAALSRLTIPPGPCRFPPPAIVNQEEAFAALQSLGRGHWVDRITETGSGVEIWQASRSADVSFVSSR
jgi:hypothetical protein